MATKICLCCGKSYNYCPNCGKNSSTPWMADYDTEACRELFNAISGYNMELFKEDVVKNVLNKYSITDYSNYIDNVKEVLNKINSKSSISFKEAEEIKSENVVEESITDNSINEYPTEEVPRRGRRNRYFE